MFSAPTTHIGFQLSTEQKGNIKKAIEQLSFISGQSSAEVVAINILTAILKQSSPINTQLLANYPNPFNPETWIPFRLAQDSTVVMEIYDVTGKPVRLIELGNMKAGNYIEADRAVYWDGTTEDGELVASGTYFYQLKTENYTEIRNMVILK